MRSSVRIRFRLEAAVAALTGAPAVVTLFWRDWIEALTGFDPDRHGGSLEWAIVAALLATCVVAAVAARADRRRLRPATAR